MLLVHVTKTSISEFNISVSSWSILRILNWLRMNIRMFLLLEKFRVFEPGQKSGRVELRSWFFHLIETSIIIIDISISTSTIWLINDASVPHHFDPIMIFRSWNSCVKVLRWDVVIVLLIRKLLHIQFN